MVSHATHILKRAEAELAELAAHVASRQAYAEAARLLELADGVAQLRRGFASTGREATIKPPSLADGRRSKRPTRSEADRSRRTADKDPAAGVDAYPKFRKDGDEIVKIGRSKSAGQTYEHRSPLAVLRRLCEVALNVADDRHRFSTEQVFPLRDSAGHELPSYQGYLCLAWLRRTGLIRADGRARYLVPAGGALLNKVQEKIEAMPAR